MLIKSPDPRSEPFRLSVRGLLRRETHDFYPSSSRASSEPAHENNTHKKHNSKQAAATNESNNKSSVVAAICFKRGLRRVFFLFNVCARGQPVTEGLDVKPRGLSRPRCPLRDDARSAPHAPADNQPATHTKKTSKPQHLF